MLSWYDSYQCKDLSPLIIENLVLLNVCNILLLFLYSFKNLYYLYKPLYCFFNFLSFFSYFFYLCLFIFLLGDAIFQYFEWFFKNIFILVIFVSLLRIQSSLCTFIELYFIRAMFPMTLILVFIAFVKEYWSGNCKLMMISTLDTS